jgi:hypothetical protein
MDDLLSKMEVEVNQLKSDIPCLSVGKETEKLILDSSSLSHAPPAPPSECSTTMVSSTIKPSLIFANNNNLLTKKNNFVMYLIPSRGNKWPILLVLWLLIAMTQYIYPPSFLFVLPAKSSRPAPPQTTRIPSPSPQFSYFRWVVYSTVFTALFWGFHKWMSL